MIAVSIDGVLVPPEHAAISVFDRGLLFGDGLFEILRTWDGIAVDLEAHLDRLYEAAARLQIKAMNRELLAASVQRAITAAAAGEHRIRIILTRGPGPLVARIAALGPGRAIVIVEPLPPQSPQLTLAVVDWPLPRRNRPGAKTLAYLDHILARELAADAGADEGIRLDHEGNVVEGATSNIFAVRSGTVITPAIDEGVLPGITRARVLAICDRLGIATAVRTLPLSELQAADELFVTSALRGVVAVTRLDGVSRTAGPISAQIADEYERVMSET
ncbi:MAG: Branched-chain-amino-acid transaminase [Myxococcales bacterium]|nr:Branched-chain-amino-acid transaminase [Myxococcales bacterium]